MYVVWVEKFALLLTKLFPKCSLLEDLLHSQRMMHIPSAWWCRSRCIHRQKKNSACSPFASREIISGQIFFSLIVWLWDCFKIVHLGTVCFKESNQAFPELIFCFWFLHCGHRTIQFKRKMTCWGHFDKGNKLHIGSLQTGANAPCSPWPCCFLGFF